MILETAVLRPVSGNAEQVEVFMPDEKASVTSGSGGLPACVVRDCYGETRRT